MSIKQIGRIDGPDGPVHYTLTAAPDAATSILALKDGPRLFVVDLLRHVNQPYHVPRPDEGWRARESFTDEEKARLRPVAETLAMLDGNAFFGAELQDGADWYEQYLPEAHALAGDWGQP